MSANVYFYHTFSFVVKGKMLIFAIDTNQTINKRTYDKLVDATFHSLMTCNKKL